MAEPVRVRVRVKAGARKESFVEEAGNVFAASVREPAERNEANARVRALVAAHFRVPVTAVRILTGARGPGKTLLVRR